MMNYDLAPQNPYGLVLQSPVLARAGVGGAGIERLSNWPGIGGVLTDPLLVRDWLPEAPQATPGGLIWHQGGRAIRHIRKDMRRWRNQVVLPVLMPFDAHEANELLEPWLDEETPAIVLDITELQDIGQFRAIMNVIRPRWQAPLLIELASDTAWKDIFPQLEQSDGIILARGPIALRNDTHLGRLIGPASEPMIAATVQALRKRSNKPLIVGVSTFTGAQQALANGAQALMLDTALWIDPQLAEHIQTLFTN